MLLSCLVFLCIVLQYFLYAICNIQYSVFYLPSSTLNSQHSILNYFTSLYCRARKEFSSVDRIPEGNTLPHRLASFEMVIYMQSTQYSKPKPKPESDAGGVVFEPSPPDVSITHIADLLCSKGCCIVGGRAGTNAILLLLLL